LRPIQEFSRYEAEPLHRSPEHGELFARFKAGIESRKNALADIKEHEDVILAAIGKSGRPSGGRLRKTQAC